jgi:hypothetical protein
MKAVNATVKDVMTTEVVAVRRDTTFKEKGAALHRYRVSALPRSELRARGGDYLSCAARAGERSSAPASPIVPDRIGEGLNPLTMR